MNIKTALFPLLLSSFFVSALQAESIWIAGTGGIYRSELDQTTGALSEPVLACAYGSGSFLAIHPKLDVIYSSYSDKPRAGYASLVPNGKVGELEIQSVQLLEEGAAPPSHVAIDSKGALLTGSHYRSELVYVFDLDTADGRILPGPLQLRQHGSGPGRAQTQSRPHWGGFSDNDTVYHSVDLGSDEIWTYSVGEDSQSVELLHTVKLPPGTGPRHMSMSLDGDYAYVSGELSKSLVTLFYDKDSHRFSPLQYIPTLAEGEEIEASSLSEIQVHPKGEFLYTAVRGNNLIVAFRIDPDTGLLSLIERQEAMVDRPRNFTVSDSGNWLLVAGRDSDNLVVFSIDQDTGELEPTGVEVSVPGPICVRAWGRF